MKISIITVCYNSAATIRDTLSSVESQSYSNIEHIVIDGNSTDETVDIVKSFRHVSKLVSEPDDGLYDAMNKGIALASGELIGILNSDDFYAHNEVLQSVAMTITKHQTAALYGDLRYVHPHATQRTIRYWQSGRYRPKRFRLGWMPPHPTFFVRKEIYEKLGRFDSSFSSAADYELMLRFLYKHRISACYLPEILVHMRTGGLSNASFRHRWRANREDRRAWLKNGLRPPFYTFLLKPLRKIPQYFRT